MPEKSTTRWLPWIAGLSPWQRWLSWIARLSPWQRWLAWIAQLCPWQRWLTLGLLDSVHGSDGLPGLLGSVHGSDVCAGLPGLLNCAPFLLGGVSSPDASCCKSLKWLRQHAMKKGDKRELCKCLKVEDLKHKGVILDRAKTLPRLCKVKLPCAARA
ncbi:LIPID TRANSFER PROTEIN [Salix koriyanagi]|uniref:LIPID TRANSFER PROTEIN n=1 Tax=Salix koriyanagi TaxID=2511006 RepID=A0A9Q0ZBX1_9ROSI|nr:LIPID TRANSFER PROTEIN [Salix koriyanagi]